MLRVDAEKLDEVFHSAGTQYLLEGVPFTGVAYIVGPEDGPWIEIEYSEGFPNGVVREWYTTGQLCHISYHRGSERFRLIRTWFENGQIKEECILEYGTVISEKKWNESGKTDFRLWDG